MLKDAAIWLAIMGGPAIPMGTVDDCLQARTNLIQAGQNAYCIPAYQHCVKSDGEIVCQIEPEKQQLLQRQWSE